jgi:small GTP-binding protein
MSDSSSLPIVAIVGRPNVGKSRLFNRYAGHSRALVHDQAGITRDRIAEEVRVEPDGAPARRILLVDTAGLDRGSEDELAARVQVQARCAVDQADAILFVVDSKSGLLPEDEEIARTLRRTRKPVVLVVNKVDIPEHMDRLGEFYGLGFEVMHAVSAEHGGGAFDALEQLVAALPEASAEEGDARASRRFFGPPEMAAGEVPDFSEEALDGDFGASQEEQGEARQEEQGEAGMEAVSWHAHCTQSFGANVCIEPLQNDHWPRVFRYSSHRARNRASVSACSAASAARFSSSPGSAVRSNSCS